MRSEGDNLGLKDTPELRIDLTQLTELSGGDPEFIVEILEMIIENTPAAIRSMTGLLEENDYEMLSKVAHKLKSTLNILSDQHVLQVLDWLEHTAKDKPDSPEIPVMVKYMSRYTEMLVEFLTREINHLKHAA